MSVGKHDGIVTLHSRDDMVPGDLVVNRLVLGSSNEFAEVEFWSGGRGFCVLRVEFNGLGARGREIPSHSI